MPLGKNADAGDYVKDFYKSKAPQFKGKSKNKRRQMAIAAYLDARDKGKAKSEEMTFKVEVDGLPAMYIDGNSPGQVKNHLRKLIKQPSMIKGVSRMTKYDVKKTYRAKAQGKDVEEEDMSGYLKSIGGPNHGGRTATPADIAAINKHLRDTRKQRVRSHPLGYKHSARAQAARSGVSERYDYPHGTAKAYKAATPGQEKGDGYMEPKKEAARIPRKKGQPANSKKHSDLYTDENPKGTIHGLKFATVADAKTSVAKIKKSSRKHAHKIQAAIAMEQRARVAGKNAEAAVYRKYINSMKKKTKAMKENYIVKQYKNGKTTGVVKRFKGLKQATAHADKQGGDHRVHKEDSHGVRRLPLGKRNPDNPVSKKAKELVKTLPPSKPLKDLGKMDELKYTTMNKYMSKAKRSKDRATNSAVATILRKGDHSKDLQTMKKRDKGMKLAKSRAVDKIRKGASEAKRTVTIDRPDRLTSLRVSKDKPPFDNAKPANKDPKDKFGNIIKNRARSLARAAAKKAGGDMVKKEEWETIRSGPGFRIQKDSDTGATRRVADKARDRKIRPEANAMDMVKANNAQSKKGYKTEKLTIPKIRNIMYKGAKALGDVQAVRKKKVGKRVARRAAGKLASRALRSLIKNDVQEGKGGKPESFEAQYKRRVVKTTKPEHKEKGYNWRIKGKDRPEISIKLYKSKPGQAEFNKQLRRVAGHEFGG